MPPDPSSEAGQLPACIQMAAADMATVKHLYTHGLSIATIAQSLGIPYGRVRRDLIAAGMLIRSRMEACRVGLPRPTSKLSVEERQRLVAELQACGKQYQQLANEYGITRERVRQIAKAAHTPCGRDLQRKLVLERSAARNQMIQARAAQRKQARDARYRLWKGLWRQGLSLREMGDQLGLSPCAIGVRITELRHSHPGWFPYRRIPAALRIMTQP